MSRRIAESTPAWCVAHRLGAERWLTALESAKAGIIQRRSSTPYRGRRMSMSLADALQLVDLEAGRIYQCRVGKLRVQVRVEEHVLDSLPAPLASSDVMLDPWTDLPAPQPAALVDVAFVARVLPDVPEIPDDWQHA